MFEVFEAHMLSQASFTAADMKLIRSLAREKKIRKRQVVLREGEVCRQKIFICKGLLNTYMRKEDGIEYIMRFAAENMWTVDPVSYNNQTPTKYTIDAIEDTDVVVWAREDMQTLMDAIPVFRKYSEKLKENSLDASLDRIMSNISATSEEKYQE